jgi:hypothetical protein
VIYAAKSTEDRRGSIPAQLEECRAVIEAKGRSVIAGTYRDEAISAYTTALVGLETDAKRHQKGTSGENEGALASIEGNAHHAKVAG